MSSLWSVWSHTPAEDRQAFVHELCMRYSPLVCEALKRQHLCHGRVITDCEIDQIVTMLDYFARRLEAEVKWDFMANDARAIINQLRGGE